MALNPITITKKILIIFLFFSIEQSILAVNAQDPIIKLEGARNKIIEQLANSYDAGDSYQTPLGQRKLYRIANKIVIRLNDKQGMRVALNNLTANSGVLSEYEIETELPGGIIVLNSRQDEIYNDPNITPLNILSISTSSGIKQLSPVFIDPDSGFWMITTQNIIIQLEKDADSEDVFSESQVQHIPATKRQYLLAMPNSTSEEIFAEVDRLFSVPGVTWAEPDFISQSLVHALNDEYYNQLWHLHNTGQSGGYNGADIDAPEAWELTTGSSNIVIAILDSGVQTNHPDLQQNIFSNSLELNGITGIDDDNNGYTDDIRGWDFYTNWAISDGNDGNDDPNPKVIYDFHGTNVAGVAAARGNNDVGIAGIAYTSRILPIRITQQTDWSGNSSYNEYGVAAAIRYAAGIDEDGDPLGNWQGADIINISLSLDPDSTAIWNALHMATLKGRNGKGCAIFCSTGNSPDGWRSYSVSIPSAGTYTFRWTYDGTNSQSFASGNVWLDMVTFPDGTTERFEGVGLPGLPNNWTTSDISPWSNVINGSDEHAMTDRDGQISRSLRSGSGPVRYVPGSYSSFVEITKYISDGIFQFWYWPNQLIMYDTFRLNITGSSIQPFEQIFNPDNIKQENIDSIAYPASHPDTIAVGASSNFDYRAGYSQYGNGIDFLAPGGGNLLGIITTDRTGNDGKDNGNYTETSGTSFSSPLAAGVAALMLSRNLNLTADQIRSIMRNTCDKVDAVPDVNGWNQYYGYGRINARKAVDEAVSTGSLTVTINPQGVINAGARWKRVGTSTWRTGGSMESNIPMGNYTVEFNNISGWDKPDDKVVTVNKGETTYITSYYVQQRDSQTVIITP